jgi:ethanolamine utilization protein EutQ (cupin superfamily)
MGVASVRPLLGRDDEAGMLVGISEFKPGSVDLDLTYDEGVFMLEGEIEIDGDGETHRVAPGEFLWLPRGRKIVYRAAAPCRFLYVIPGSIPPS